MDEVRVSALAKEFGMTSKEMLAVLDDLKIPARSASSPLDGAFVRIVREKLPILYPEKVAIQAEAKRRREEERQEDLQRREQARQHEERLLEERCARERERRKARELVRVAEHAARDVNRERRRKESFTSRYASLLAQIEAQEATAKCKSPDVPEKGRWDDLCDKLDVGLIDELLRQLRRKGYLPEEASVESVRDAVLSSFERTGLIEHVPCEESWEHSPDIRSSYYWRVTDAGLESGIVQGTAKVSTQNFHFSALFPIFLGRGASLVFDELDRQGVLLEDPEAELEKRKRAEVRRMEIWRRAPIKKVVQDRGIEKLYHFTSAENLSSIFEHGILSRSELREQGISPVINDENRLDDWYSGISLSVSWPNYQFFQRVKSKYPERTYALLELDPSILYELDCAFFPTNAANKEMKKMHLQERQSAAAFEELFQDRDGYYRKRHETQACFTTDPQAEVFSFDSIPTKYIRAVDFESHAAAQQFSDAVPQGVLCREGVDEFKYRFDWEFWQAKLEERKRDRATAREKYMRKRYGGYDEYDEYDD